VASSFRALIYFAIWLALMFVFDRLSKQQDVNQSDRALRRRLKMLAGPGIILYAFAMTFAAIDWVDVPLAALGSTIYGFLFIAGQLISSMAFMIAVVALLRAHRAFFQRPAETSSARSREVAPRFRDALGLL